MFPGGVLVAADHMHLSKAIRDTRELVGNREVPAIFEAAFEHCGVVVRVNVLKRNGTGFRPTEVKSSTKIKPEYTDDVSIQKYVVGGCGLQVQGTNLMHLSRDYIYDGTLGADERSVDQAASEYERQSLVHQAATARQMLKNLTQALERMRQGTFGECTECGGDIELKRLEAIPWARYCVRCQEARERG